MKINGTKKGTSSDVNGKFKIEVKFDKVSLKNSKNKLKTIKKIYDQNERTFLKDTNNY